LFSRVFELPLPKNAQKRTKKKKVRTYFVLRAGADVRRFLVLFFLPPLGFFAVNLRDDVAIIPNELTQKEEKQRFIDRGILQCGI
jgi:hypothetical protein